MREAIILAGGLGTRLQSALPNLPKAMAPCAGKPFLEIIITELCRGGFDRIILSLGYLADAISNHFDYTFMGVELVHVVEPRPLGTGGAVKHALQHANGDAVFVFNGDTYLSPDCGRMEEALTSQTVAVMLGRHVSEVSRFGALTIENSLVAKLLEKGGSGAGFINAGCYLLDKKIASFFPETSSFSLERDVFLPAIGARKVAFVDYEGPFIDIGVPRDYARAQAFFEGLASGIGGSTT